MLAYLVIREGSKWTDVFRLVPGRTVTIGRGATNQIVVKDERCSRNHAEIFMTQGRWTVRDLDSRTGTSIDGVLVEVARVRSHAVLALGRSRIRCRVLAGDERGAPPPAGRGNELPPIDTSIPLRQARQQWIDYFERCYLAALLEETGQNVTAAARRAGIDRVHMHRLLSRAGLR